jgi:DNA/RNA endonuclease YhcR with UshA esterase domain
MTVPAPDKNDVQCPHCGHFTGPSSRCAHCGLRLEKRMGLKLLRTVAVVVAIGGLFLLQLYAQNREIPLVSIHQISPVMNFATVRVEGLLESDARNLRSGSQLYVIDDGTGTLAVFANEPVIGKLPRAGSRIAVTGNLNVGAGNEVRMQARTVEVLDAAVVDEFISEFRLADITAEQVDDRITVFGTVSKVWKSTAGSKAPSKIILTDPSGSLEVVHWLKEPIDVEVDDSVEITGTVGVYKGQLQLKLWNVDDFQPLEIVEVADPREIDIGKITAEMADKVVIAEGVFGPPQSIPGGVIYPMTDETGTILALFWDKNISGEERDALDEDVRVRIEAPVVVYKGKLELVPVDVGGFQVLE